MSIMTAINPLTWGDAHALATAPVLVPRPDRSLGLDPRFANVAKVGEGGSAEVYRCLDRQSGITVALKRLRSEKTNRRSDWDRFISEPTLMKRIDHPVVPMIHEIFPERMYKPYFTMEWIDGIDLCRVLSGLRSETGPLVQLFPLRRLVQILVDVCEGLAVAHRQGVIHRDIKPENIMITQAGETKLVDWGVALCTGQPNHDAPTEKTIVDRRQCQSNRDDQCIGSPLYMSPEQVKRVTDIDARTDVYSMGAVLYDCLSLTPMIGSTKLPSIFQEIVHGEPTPPSQRSRRDVVPSSLESVCMKAVSKDPRSRYSSIESMGAAMRRCLG